MLWIFRRRDRRAADLARLLIALDSLAGESGWRPAPRVRLSLRG